MKNFFNKNRFYIIAIILIAFVFLITYYLCNFNPHSIRKQTAQQSKSIVDKKIDLSQVQQWKDKYNQLHYELEKIQVEKEVLQVFSDSLAKVLKIKPKQIQSITQIKSGISFDQKLNYEFKIDSLFKNNTKSAIKYTKFSYNDKWMQISGDIGKTDSIHIKGIDSLTKVDYEKKKWFLGRKHYYSDFSNKNPYIVIEGLKQVEVKKTIDKWGIGPSFTAGVKIGDKVQIIPIVGISLQYNIITF